MSRNVRLCMIEKDESAVIERCVNSVKPLISSYSIDDTGSTDNTVSILHKILEGIPGKVHHEPWVNFAHNRSMAIKHAQEDGTADYLLLGIDSDEELILPAGYQLPQLVADCYRVEMHYNGITYYRPFMVKASLPWRYECVTHEYLHLDEPYTVGKLEGPYVLVRCEGARSRDPQKYQKDAATIQAALDADPNGPHVLRYLYYLAQSHKDAGDKEKALRFFKLRASLEGWVEERYMAALWAARLMESLDSPFNDVVMAYLKAWEILPPRIEALGNLARYSRLHNRFALATLFARTAAVIGEPPESLFKEAYWYQWAALDELAVSSFYINDFGTCHHASKKLLESPTTPSEQKPRIEANMKFAADRLGHAKQEGFKQL